ncbi:MAG: GDSL-type esterase/lipase family protein [Melioribacteraceae bacterium]|nr:GDSL-type esterase/lipase family protein [Melioribacteraceae bacterium]
MNKETRKKAPIWFYFVLIIIPLLLIVLLEIGLRVFNYGKDYSPFITIDENFSELYFPNPDLTFKYFKNVKNPPSVIYDSFTKIKDENTYRIFVLGGSSTAGWPYGFNVPFPRYIKRRLELLYPDNNIEVINLGITAVNTYTIRDLVPDILEQKPDLILIYAGHNEFYGALGVGSNESIGKSKTIINIVLWLRNFKITQLVENLISSSAQYIAGDSSERKAQNETLMSKMIGEKAIPFGSEDYKLGLEQFEYNMQDIIEEIKAANVNLIIGTLTSNLKQKPFISESITPYEKADKVYEQAEQLESAQSFLEAKKKYYKAKDLDALRFRAPEDFNKTIFNLGKKYGVAVIAIDSIFNSKSPNGITGYNLMTDHLHPTVQGYQLIGKIFFDKMISENFLPKFIKKNISIAVQEEYMKDTFPYTPLDSVIADIRLRKLLGAYPFVPKNSENELIKNLRINNKIDSIAVEIYNQELTYSEGHRALAKHFYEINDADNFIKEMNAVTNDQPYVSQFYVLAGESLINMNRFDDALLFLNKLIKLERNSWVTKWIGSIYLSKKNYSEAEKYLKESVSLDQNDAQTLYNLAGAYFYTGKIDEAIAATKACLSINNNYPGARQFLSGLTGLKNKGN